MTKPPPYPSDTRARGWRFELDPERIRQSDTWALTPSEMRPWLLMIWMTAWEQVPCGSMPSDDALVAARIGMKPAAFSKARATLMRGWWMADDGRLYHDTVAERVLEMLAAKTKERDRKAAYRQRMDAERTGGPMDVPRDAHGTNPGCDATGTGTGTGLNTSSLRSEGVPRKRSTRSAAHGRPDDVSEQVWADWCDLRKRKKAPVTETVLSGARSEASKAGLPLERFLAIWCLRGTQGLMADWLRSDERGHTQRSATAAEQRVLQAVPGLAAPHLRPEPQSFETIDMEGSHVPARRLG